MKKKILIIDDEPALLNAMRLKLEASNFNVLLASFGQEGLEKVKEKPDLILLDIIMPGMNGFEVLEKIKENKETKDIPVIILSNSGKEEEGLKGLQFGACDYLVKATLSLDEMVEKVKSYL